MSIQKQWQTDITVTDERGPMRLGLADKWDGANKTADPKTYARARGNIVLPGVASREKGKATYLFADIRHFDDRLDAAVDKSCAVVVSRWEIGPDGQPLVGGKVTTYTGVIASYGQPEGDAGGEDGSTVEIEFTLDTDRA